MPASRIMIVEDAETIRLAVATALRSHGFEVTPLTDGANLEAELGANLPDLVLLDVMLPGRDGFELLDLIRQSSTSAVIMLTARDTTADRVRGADPGGGRLSGQAVRDRRAAGPGRRGAPPDQTGRCRARRR